MGSTEEEKPEFDAVDHDIQPALVHDSTECAEQRLTTDDKVGSIDCGIKEDTCAEPEAAKDTQPEAKDIQVNHISQSLGQLLTRIRTGAPASETVADPDRPESAQGGDESSRVASLGQSLYTGTGQLLGAVQAWRYGSQEQSDAQVSKEVVASSETDTDAKELDTVSKLATSTEAAATDSKLSSFSKSIYASGEQLLSSVQAWREKTEEQNALEATMEGKHSSLEGMDVTDDKTVDPDSSAGKGDGTSNAEVVEASGDLATTPEELKSSSVEPSGEVPMGRRSTAEEWEVVEDIFVKCWRCGKLVSPQMDAIEKHSQICSRPSLPEMELAEKTEEQEEEPTRERVGIEDALSAIAETPQVEEELDTCVVADTSTSSPIQIPEVVQTGSGRGLVLGQTLAVAKAPLATSSASSIAISTAAKAVTAVTRLKNSALEAKDRAYRHYCSRGVVLPESVDVNIQMAHTALFLSCDGINTSVESSGLGLRCDGVGEESAWVLIKLEADEVYKVKSALSGRCLLVATGEDGVAICLSNSDASPGGSSQEAEWRITKGTKGGSFVFQNVASGLYLEGKSAGVLDGTEVEAVQNLNEDCDWIVAAVRPPQENGEESASQKPSVLDAITPDLDAYVLYNRVEATMERSILMALDPVLHGIPALGIASAKEEAKKLKAEHGTAEAAIAALKAKIDTDEAPASMSHKIMMKVSELLVLRFMPFAGAGAYLSFTLYTRLRLAALIAEIYGVDTDSAETQSMLLFCIAPDGSTASENDHSADVELEDEEKSDSKSGVRNIVVGSARILAHTLVRQVLKRATGWKTAADLYDLAAAVASEGYTHVRGDGSEVEAAPQVEGGQQATFRRGSLLFKPSLNKTVQPFTLGLLCLGAALPAIVSALRHIMRLMIPILGLQVTVACVVCSATTIGIVGAAKRYDILDFVSEVAYEHPELISSVVCVVHSALPLKAAFDATGTVIDGTGRGLDARIRSEMAGQAFLMLLLGLWSWLRILQRCFAEPHTPAARGESTNAQKVLLCIVVCMGMYDIFGPDGLALHSWRGFSSLGSHHWFLGLLNALALECQMSLITSLRDRDTLLRLLGATRMMSLALVLFLGGLTASVGFLVSRTEFSRFVDTLAPPPQVMVVILTLRRRFYTNALVLGIGLGILWYLPNLQVYGMFMRLLGLCLGAYGTAKLAITFEEYRESLLEPNGGRWLLLFPETSEIASAQAMKVWGQFKQEAADKAISKGTAVVGNSVISKALDYAASYWSRAPLDKVATAAIEAAEKVEGH